MMPDEAPEKIEFSHPPSPKDFWILYAHSLDWQIIMHRFVMANDPNHGKKPLDPKVAFVGFDGPSATPVYYLSREYFPVEKIAALIGKEPTSLEGIEFLHLREFKDADGKPAQDKWQKPNVDYWGMA